MCSGLFRSTLVNAGEIADRLQNIRQNIETAISRSEGKVREVTIVAASKQQTAESIASAIRSGIRDFGENRLQDAELKMTGIQPAPTWHFIGRIQSNKIRRIFSRFDWVQSVDSLDVMRKAQLHLDAEKAQKNILLQVNMSGESQKGGFDPLKLQQLMLSGFHQDYPRLCIRGLMTVGLQTADASFLSGMYRQFRRLFLKGQSVIPGFDTLSGGMSGDYETAITEGCNMVRLGTVIFGPRI